MSQSYNFINNLSAPRYFIGMNNNYFFSAVASFNIGKNILRSALFNGGGGFCLLKCYQYCYTVSYDCDRNRNSWLLILKWLNLCWETMMNESVMRDWVLEQYRELDMWVWSTNIKMIDIGRLFQTLSPGYNILQHNIPEQIRVNQTYFHLLQLSLALKASAFMTL